MSVLPKGMATTAERRLEVAAWLAERAETTRRLMEGAEWLLGMHLITEADGIRVASMSYVKPSEYQAHVNAFLHRLGLLKDVVFLAGAADELRCAADEVGDPSPPSAPASREPYVNPIAELLNIHVPRATPASPPEPAASGAWTGFSKEAREIFPATAEMMGAGEGWAVGGPIMWTVFTGPNRDDFVSDPSVKPDAKRVMLTFIHARPEGEE